MTITELTDGERERRQDKAEKMEGTRQWRSGRREWNWKFDDDS